jgi:glutathione S-transferase
LFAATELERNAGVYVTNRYVLSAEKRDGQAADKAAEELKKPLGVLNQVLGKTSYLLGSSFTVADMNVASVLYGNWYAKSDLLSPYPQVKAWLDRCLERPAAMAARKLREG